MSKWQRTLNLQPQWGEAKAGTIGHREMAGVIAARLGEFKDFNIESIDVNKADLVAIFNYISEETDTDVEEFDDAMSELYDWADTSLDGEYAGQKVCWVKTVL